jgi:Family of unknown function (DUF6493)
MTIEEQFSEIIKKEQKNALITFLKGLDPNQKKQLAAPIKKLIKEYSQYGNIGGNQWGHIKGTEKQRDMLQLCSFVCHTRLDYEKSQSPFWFLSQDHLKDVIDWYVPDWFSDFVNKTTSVEYFSLSYNWLIHLTEMGVLKPSKELIVRSMPAFIFERTGNKWHFKPENVLKKPITLQEHIWYLFEIESSINWSGRYLFFGENEKEKELGWITVLQKYSDEGLISRQRLLKESLMASNKNFNKTLSGWFMELFTEFKPGKTEILHLQQELFSVLNSSHSNVVNEDLRIIKQIADDDQFEFNSFVDCVPILLASDTKATVASTLMILEKLARRIPEIRQNVTQQISQVFVQPSNDLQVRAAKIIDKYGENEDPVLREEIGKYWQNIMQASRQILHDFVPPPAEDVINAKRDPVSNLQAAALPEAIPDIETIDDLVFLASQAFDNNETWHFEYLANSIIKLNSQFNSENIIRFEPAFQRALNLVKNGLRSNLGLLDHLLAMFFIDFGNYLILKFPKAGESIRNFYRKYDHMDGETKRSWTVSPQNSSYTAGWHNAEKIPFYEPFKQLLILTQKRITAGDPLSLLSTPTHLPCWIMPEVLINRLGAYEENKKEPGNMDLQIAISRCYLPNPGNAIKIAANKLSGEMKRLMIFLLDENAEPEGPFENKGAWMIASVAKKEKKKYPQFARFSYYKEPFEYYTGNFNWESVDEAYIRKQYDYKIHDYKDVSDRRKILRVLMEKNAPPAGAVKKLISKVFPSKDDPPLLYDFLKLKVQFLSVQHNDIKRVLFLTPNNTEITLAYIINQCLQFPTFSSESDKKMVIATMQALYDIDDNYGEMAHLFFGTCMISSDKTAAGIAAETWIKSVTNSKINSTLLGTIIGRHEKIELAPLKRFTDLAIQSMFRVSDLHNKKLQELIAAIIVELPQQPIKNQKKLVELFNELEALNNFKIEDLKVLKS